MVIKRVFIACCVLLFSISAFAADKALQSKRMDVLSQYVTLLGQGAYTKIPLLFTQNAVAVSSSGKADNVPDFYKTLFTKTISNPKSELINIFEGKMNPNMLSAYFTFSWTNINGKAVSARFLDLMVFERGTAKIKQIYVFSNTFSSDIMKQLQN